MSFEVSESDVAVSESGGQRVSEFVGFGVSESGGQRVSESEHLEVSESAAEVSKSGGRRVSESEGLGVSESGGQRVSESKGLEVSKSDAEVSESDVGPVELLDASVVAPHPKIWDYTVMTLHYTSASHKEIQRIPAQKGLGLPLLRWRGAYRRLLQDHVVACRGGR